MAGVKGAKTGKASAGSGRTKASYKTADKNKTAKATAKARSCRTEASFDKQAVTKSTFYNAKRIAPEVSDFIRESLLKPINKNSKTTTLQAMITSFIQDAVNDPTGKAAQIIMTPIFTNGDKGIVDILDDFQNRQMAQDNSWKRYRIRETLFSKQQEVFDDNENEEIEIICSRRAGKTELDARILVAACIEKDTPCLYINLTFTNAISQQYGLCLKLANEYGLEIEKASSNEGIITFKNGSSITFRGNSTSAESEKLRGGKYKVIIVDEIGHQRWLKYLIEDVLSPLQKDFFKHKIIYTGTPPRVPHHYSEWLWNNPKVKHYHWTMKENPFMPNAEEEIKKEAEKRGMSVDNTYIKREYLGIMGAYDTESQVYKGYQVYKELPTYNFTPTNVYIGVDWGGVDNNAVCVLAADRYSKKAFVTEEFKQNNMTVTEICNKIIAIRDRAIDFAKGLNPDFDEARVQVICDNNELDNLWELSREYHIPNVCKAYKTDMMFAIQQLAEFVRTGQILIKEKGIIADEFDQILYKRDDDTGAILNELDDTNYHGDIEAALRYASRNFAVEILAIDENKPAKPIEDNTVNPDCNPYQNNNTDNGVIWD